MHHPLALQAGVRQEVLDALAEGCQPLDMVQDEKRRLMSFAMSWRAITACRTRLTSARWPLSAKRA